MRRNSIIVVATVLGALAAASVATANEVVYACDTYGNHIAAMPANSGGMKASARCPGEPLAPPPSTGGMSVWPVPRATVKKGKQLRWIVTTPPGLTIDTVNIAHMYSVGIND